MATKEEVTNMVSQLCEKFGKPLDPTLIATFVEALEEATIASVDEIVKLLVRECTFFPRPEQVLSHIKASRDVFHLSESRIPDHWKLVTYECATCNDIGIVTVWHHKTMQAAIDRLCDRIDQETYVRRKHTMSCPCTCRLGDQFENWNIIHNGKVIEKHRMVRYCFLRMVRPNSDLPNDDASLMEWSVKWLADFEAGDPQPQRSKLREAGIVPATEPENFSHELESF